MTYSPQIAIILPDTLQRVGLRSLLTDYFPPVEISLFSSYEAFLPFEKDFFDFFFTNSDILVLHTDFFLPVQSKTICVISSQPALSTNRPNGLTVLCADLSQEEIVKQLRTMLHNQFHTPQQTGNELSDREKDVLRLVVKGMINKEIARKLYISLNTVLTHRKNITSKLGIKTVPGLTFYAITNGLIT